jgi:hypothetical protein
MRRRVSEFETAELAQDLANLTHLSEESLNDHFRRLYGVEPPTRMRRPLLICAIAYRLQEKALGGLKPATRRLLASVAADATARRTMHVASERKIRPGTTLVALACGLCTGVLIISRPKCCTEASNPVEATQAGEQLEEILLEKGRVHAEFQRQRTSQARANLAD